MHRESTTRISEHA